MKKSILKTTILWKICSVNCDDSFVIISAEEIEEAESTRKKNGWVLVKKNL